MSFTRRTHIVRVADPNNKQRYVDVEVLDAVAFRGPDGKIMVFNCPAKNAAPYVLDNTGDGNTIAPSKPTRTSHMERITNPDDSSQFIDIEVLDYLAFVTPNGEKWVLDMPSKASHPYIEDNTGSGTSGTEGGGDPTRRMTINRVKNPANDSQFISVGRPDAVSFHKVNGEKLVLYSPDKLARPSTTPPDYQPDNAASVPPDNTDPNPYIRWPKGGTGGPWLGNARVKQGPLWWIRAAKSAGTIGVLEFSYDFTSVRDNAWGASFSLPGSTVIFAQSNILLPLGNTHAPPHTPSQPSPPTLPFAYWQWPGVTTDEVVTTPGGTTTIIDREIDNVFTDMGVIDSYINNGFNDIIHFTSGRTITWPNATFEPFTSVPFLVDHNGDTSDGALTDAQVHANMLGIVLGFQNHGYPMSVAEPTLLTIVESHDEDLGSTSVFHKTGSFIAFFDLSMIANGPTPPLTTVVAEIDTMRQILSGDHLTWSAAFSTWKTIADWPVDDTNTPLWAGTPISSAEIDNKPSGESKVPESIAHFAVNMTDFTVTGTRTDL